MGLNDEFVHIRTNIGMHPLPPATKGHAGYLGFLPTIPKVPFSTKKVFPMKKVCLGNYYEGNVSFIRSRGLQLWQCTSH